MTEPRNEHPIAVFADQVQPGMTIEHPSPLPPELGGRWDGRALVTQVRSRTGRSFFGDTEETTVSIIGVFEDGRPFDYCCGSNMTWYVHNMTEVTS